MLATRQQVDPFTKRKSSSPYTCLPIVQAMVYALSLSLFWRSIDTIVGHAFRRTVCDKTVEQERIQRRTENKATAIGNRMRRQRPRQWGDNDFAVDCAPIHKMHLFFCSLSSLVPSFCAQCAGCLLMWKCLSKLECHLEGNTRANCVRVQV